MACHVELDQHHRSHEAQHPLGIGSRHPDVRAPHARANLVDPDGTVGIEHDFDDRVVVEKLEDRPERALERGRAARLTLGRLVVVGHARGDSSTRGNRRDGRLFAFVLTLRKLCAPEWLASRRSFEGPTGGSSPSIRGSTQPTCRRFRGTCDRRGCRSAEIADRDRRWSIFYQGSGQIHLTTPPLRRIGQVPERAIGPARGRCAKRGATASSKAEPGAESKDEKLSRIRTSKVEQITPSVVHTCRVGRGQERA